MTRSQLRHTCGALLVGSHFAVLFAIVGLTIADKLGRQEMFHLIGIALPLFAAFTTIVVRDFVKEPKNPARQDSQQPLPRVWITLSIPCLFAVFIAMGLYWRSFGSQALGPDDLVTYLGTAETAFGVYVGIIVKSLFDRRAG